MSTLIFLRSAMADNREMVVGGRKNAKKEEKHGYDI
jgi:hypothetical protein